MGLTMKPSTNISSWRERLEENGCPNNHGCNSASGCMCDFAEEAINALEMRNQEIVLMEANRISECKLADSYRTIVAAQRHTLTIIAEACEEIIADVNGGHDAPTLAEFAEATAVRAREAIKRAGTV